MTMDYNINYCNNNHIIASRTENHKFFSYKIFH